MIELCFIFIRNIMQIPDLADSYISSDEVYRTLHMNFLINFMKEDAANALVYATQDFSQPYMKNLNLIMLEIYYHIVAGLDPEWVM
jgi:hypothetical protein